MKRIVLAILGVLTISAGAQAQMLTDAQLIARAVMAAPERARDGAAVVKWSADGSYTQIKEGTGQWVCYDHSGGPGEQPFNVQCTQPGNLARVAQNYKLEAQAGGDRQKAAQLVAEAEANGTRVQPVYGSVWRAISGPDQASAPTMAHITIAVPGATAESLGNIPTNGRAGGVWLMAAGTSEAHLMIPN
jgi:hypothetical protein